MSGNDRAGILVVGVGGTLRAGSSTERAVQKVLGHAGNLGARTLMFGGTSLDFPMYRPDLTRHDPAVKHFLDALRSANAIVIGSPGYHGAISGLVKNALDYVEEMSSDEHPYFDGRAVGCVATGSGWQGANATLASLRCIAHALRGWPTPLGLALNSSQPLFDGSGQCLREEVDLQFRLMARQLVAFAQAGFAIAARDSSDHHPETQSSAAMSPGSARIAASSQNKLALEEQLAIAETPAAVAHS